MLHPLITPSNPAIWSTVDLDGDVRVTLADGQVIVFPLEGEEYVVPCERRLGLDRTMLASVVQNAERLHFAPGDPTSNEPPFGTVQAFGRNLYIEVHITDKAAVPIMRRRFANLAKRALCTPEMKEWLDES